MHGRSRDSSSRLSLLFALAGRHGAAGYNSAVVPSAASASHRTTTIRPARHSPFGPATEEFMSDAHRHAEEHVHDGPHEGPIKTPKQLVWAVVASFVVPIIVIIMLTQFVAVGEKEAAGTSALEAEAVAKRIHPVSAVEVKDV